MTFLQEVVCAMTLMPLMAGSKITLTPKQKYQSFAIIQEYSEEYFQLKMGIKI